MLAKLREAEREAVRFRRKATRRAKNSSVWNRTHLANLTGNLIDPENPKSRYKFWKGQAPKRQEGVVKDFTGLKNAVVAVYGEGHSANEYVCSNTLYTMRLKLAQHSRDIGMKVGTRYLLNASSEDFAKAGLS